MFLYVLAYEHQGANVSTLITKNKNKMTSKSSMVFVIPAVSRVLVLAVSTLVC